MIGATFEQIELGFEYEMFQINPDDRFSLQIARTLGFQSYYCPVQEGLKRWRYPMMQITAGGW